MSIVTGDEGKVPTDAIPQGMHTLSRWKYCARMYLEIGEPITNIFVKLRIIQTVETPTGNYHFFKNIFCKELFVYLFKVFDSNCVICVGGNWALFCVKGSFSYRITRFA